MHSAAFRFVLLSAALGAALSADAASAQFFAIESSVPTTLSLERTESGAYRLSHVGKQQTDITLTGIAQKGTVVFRLDERGRPTAEVASKLDRDRLTFTAEAGATYALGLRDAVLAPKMTIEVEGEPVLPADGVRRIVVRVQNNYSEGLSGTIEVNAPSGYKVAPRRKRRFQAGARRDAQVALRLSKRAITLADMLEGSHDDIRVLLTDSKGHRLEGSFTLHVEDAPLQQGIIVETEDLSAEATEGAAIQIRTDKVNVSGDTFSGWNDKDHWLAWHVRIPRAGKYAVVFRYCVDQQPAHRDFQLDGKYPREEFKDIVFRPTGGWSNNANDWRHHVVRDATGKPILVQLNAGEHSIRMNPIFGDGGCNLDYIMFLPEAEMPE